MPATVIVTLIASMVIPGLILALALGLRGWLLAAATPVLTYGIVGAAGSILPMIGVNWSPVTFAVSAAVLGVVGGAVRLALQRRRPADPPSAEETPRWTTAQHLVIAGAVVLGAGVGLLITWQATRGLTAVPQIWDSVWHSNATRYIAETGRSAPGALQALNNPTNPDFYYPNGFHVLAATVVMLTKASVVTVIDATVTVLTGLLALGMAALVRQCGGRAELAAAAALLSCAFTSFPYDVLPWGTLLPFNTAVALLPGFLALFAALMRARSANPAGIPTALGVGAIGMLAVHPSVITAAVVLSVGLLVQTWLRRGPRVADLGALVVSAVIAAVLGAPLLLSSVGATASDPTDWPATLKPADALGELFFFGHEQAYPQYWLAGLAALGLLAHRRSLRPLLWFVVADLIFAGLFVLAASYEGTLVTVLTRPWWNDKWRFAALWSLAAVLLSAAGIVTLNDGLIAALRRILPSLRNAPENRKRLASGSGLLVVILALTLLSGGLYKARNETRIAMAFTNGPSVSSYEQDAYRVLAGLVKPGSPVMNDPYDGSAMMWALDDVRPVFASPVIASHELATMDPDRLVLYESFNKLGSDPEVRRVVDKLGIEYVVAGQGYIGPATGPIPGMVGIEGVPGLRLVYENPDTRLYRIEPASGTGST